MFFIWKVHEHPDPAVWFFLNLFLFQIVTIICIVPHELAHALGAHLAGWNVFYIIIGIGRTLYQKRLFGIDFILKPLPTLGLTIVAPERGKYSRLGHAAFVAAGPVVNLAIVIFCIIWTIRQAGTSGIFNFPGLGTSPIFDPLVEKIAPVSVVLISNLLILVANLWPRYVKTEFGKMRSDGLALLRVWKMSAGEIAALEASNYLHKIVQLAADKNYLAAVERCETALRDFPENPSIMNLMGVTLIHLCRYHESRDIFSKLLEKASTDKVSKFVFMNNIAYADALIGDTSFLEEADRYSNEVVANLSWLSFAMGTRGTVLVEKGDVEEGIELLKKAFQSNDAASDRALNACYLAIAEKKRGNLDEFSRYLQIAKKLDPTCPLLEKASKV